MKSKVFPLRACKGTPYGVPFFSNRAHPPVAPSFFGKPESDR